MTTPRTRRPVRADWSLQGKAPGQVAYDVQAGTVGARTAQKYFWAASTETPRAGHADAPDALPWVALLGGTEDDRPVTALVETDWAGGRDATGRISYSARLWLLDFRDAQGGGLTWSSLYDAALDAPWPGGDGPAERALPLELDAAPAGVAKLAHYVESQIGFEWAARAAALLLEGRQVVITLSAAYAGLNATTRVAVLDGICSLLPYGCRAWLSASTWAGHGADHELRLTFAHRPRGDQCQAALKGQLPPEPGSATARAYLAELLRLREKRGVEQLLSHLLAHGSPLTPQDGELALRHLRDLDLATHVVQGISQGAAGILGEVSRLLDRVPLSALSAPEAATVTRFLADRGVQGAAHPADVETARTLLLRHWSPRVGEALAVELNAQPAGERNFRQASGYLALAMLALDQDPRATAALLTRYLDVGRDKPQWEGLRWRGQLLHTMQRGLDDAAAAEVTDLLTGHPPLALSWLDLNAARGTLDDALVRRLLDRALGQGGHSSPAWLRGAARIADLEMPPAPDTRDVEAFAGISPTAWRTGLALACHAGSSWAIGQLLPELRDVAFGPGIGEDDRRFLDGALDQLAPVRPGTPPRAAAFADLLQLPRQRAMRRSRAARFDERDAAEYASALATMLPGLGGSWHGPVVSGLIGEQPQTIPYPVLWSLTRPAPDGRRTGLEGLEGMALDRIADLLQSIGDWITPGMPAPWEERLRERPDLQWLAYTADIRRLVATRTPSPADMADAICRATPNSHYDKRRPGGYPSAVLEAIGPWLREHAGQGLALFSLTGRLNDLSGRRRLGDLLYHAISQLEFGMDVREREASRLTDLKNEMEQALKLLRQKPPRKQPSEPPDIPAPTVPDPPQTPPDPRTHPLGPPPGYTPDSGYGRPVHHPPGPRYEPAERPPEPRPEPRSSRLQPPWRRRGDDRR
ncbi:hypothetical protein SRB5_51090 [Streptomyces sp. RB5]|uniref:Uncharacterized protein n=1 Tax=Streptomyces smaragdinus TaxID=2585196 RepID=A0A7K0CNS3_9ACTN|nr:hypothetical protein [Streptomyces smaragdinus]MQY14933.1 hypothetical protein [Streptomyces smaragdinus]